MQQNARIIKLRGCNCKACRGHFWNRHFKSNTFRQCFAHSMNKKLRVQARIEAMTLGDVPMEGAKGFYFD